MDHLGALLLALCVFSFLLFLLRVLLIACRSFPLSLRLKEEQATISPSEFNYTTITIYVDDGPYMFFYPSYVVYVVLVFFFVIAFPLAMILVSLSYRRVTLSSC
ncbi:hypothetical protein M5D96_006901 [Drosophila gunungcola]|uniref:Uncharacterized protein n=1 Tax=Drosophila gunungcola TaxID=103775 RepID=A0A9P9YM05_9MUSC|nr:hypothetical protein M5D96_006901 [Drosophila gunungcola]